MFDKAVSSPAYKQHAATGNPQVNTVLQRQIDAADKQIDAPVHALYGLTEEEMGIVEGRGGRG